MTEDLEFKIYETQKNLKHIETQHKKEISKVKHDLFELKHDCLKRKNSDKQFIKLPSETLWDKTPRPMQLK